MIIPRSVLAAVLVLCAALNLLADWEDPERGLPVVHAFDLEEADIQGPIWAFAHSSRNTLLIGGDQLSEFDGQSWRRLAVRGGYAIRGIADGGDGRIYVGAIGELGRFEADGRGGWRYSSLLPLLAVSGIPAPKEIWQVMATQDGIAFVASQEILRYNPAENRFQVWPLPSDSRLQAFPVGRELWFCQAGVGLRRLGRAGPEALFAGSTLPEKSFVWALPSTAAAGNTPSPGEGLLIGSSTSVYRRQGGVFVRLPELSRWVEGKLPVCAVGLGGDRIALGTYLGGIAIASRSGRVESVLTRIRGLPDDHVETLWLDGRGSLWAGLDNGLAQIPVDGAVSVFDSRNSLDEPPVRKVFAFHGRTFAATSKSIYTLHPRPTETADAAFLPEPGLETGFRDAGTLGDTLMVSGFGGIWRLGSSAGWVRELHVSADIFHLLPVAAIPPLVLFLEDHALKALELTARGWAERDLRQDVGDTPLSLIRDAGGDVWVSTVNQGIDRYALTFAMGHPALRLAQHFESGKGLPTGAEGIVLTRIDSALFAFTKTAILRLNAEQTFFEPEPALAGFTALAADQNYWLVRRSDLSAKPAAAIKVSVNAHGELTWQPIAFSGAELAGRLSSLNVTSEAGHDVLWLGGSRGLLRVSAAEIPPGPAPSAVSLRRVSSGDHPVEIDGPARDLLLPAGTERVSFSFSAPGTADNGPLFYQTWLEGAESAWTAPSAESQRVYAGLPPGRYALHIRSVDAWGRHGPAIDRSFVIAAPWWKETPAVAAYGAAALLLIGLAAVGRIRFLERQAGRLNRLVQERTEELAERTRELELSNTAKSEFLENLSHEIRNPLNGIRGLSSILRESNLPPQQRDMAASLAACSGALTRVFDEVLGFAKVETGQIAVRKRSFSLRALIDEVVALHRVTATQRRSEITVAWEFPESAGGDPALRYVGDDDRIRTIVSNFVGNALKYAPGTPVEIAVELHPEGKRSEQVVISVRDHGAGVPWEEQALVFNKFVRGTNAKAQRVPGTGLGLATCKTLAEQMGGFVGLESPATSRATGKTENGAKFFLRIRLRRDRTSPSPTVPESPKESLPADAGRRRALIVEDQDYNQLITLKIAQKLGLEAEVAQDGDEALRRFSTGPYSIVFVDWEMPGMKGDEIARHVRGLPWGRQAIIVATTGHDSSEVKEACQAAGMDAFVVKPFDELAIARVLDQARSRRGEAQEFTRNVEGLNLRVFSLVGDNDPGKTARAAADYLGSMQQELAAIDEALARGRGREAAGFAHRLRSHAGFVGAAELQAAAAALESSAEKATPAERSRLRDELQRAAQAVRSEIEARAG